MLGGTCLGYFLLPAHVAAPLPRFLEGGLCRVGAASLAQLVLPLARGDGAHVVLTGSTAASSARCRCRSSCRAVIWARVLASANCRLAALLRELRAAAGTCWRFPRPPFPNAACPSALRRPRYRRRSASGPALLRISSRTWLRVRGAARLDDGEGAVALAAAHQVRQMDPGVRDRRDLQIGGFRLRVVGSRSAR